MEAKCTPTEQLKISLIAQQMEYWKNIAINMFEYDGFPEYVSKDLLSSEIIENIFFDKGDAVFFKDENLGFLCLKVQKEGKNVVGKPTSYIASGYGYNKRLSPEKCVYMKNNSLGTSTASMLQYYIEEIADIEITKRLRRNAHKTPFILDCDETTELSARNIFKKINAGEPLMLKNKMKGEGTLNTDVLNTDVSYLNDKLDDEKNNYVAQILTMLGIDNYVEDKAERVQSAEVEAQKEYIMQAFETMLECRQKACKEINEKFGLNLSVRATKDKINEKLVTDDDLEKSTQNFELEGIDE